MGVEATALTAEPSIDGAKVIVVIPVRDRRVLLRACLDGLAAQTLRCFEVVVVDDGSSDDSGAEAMLDAARGRSVRLLTAGGTGAVAARTLGVGASHSPYVAFTDSDCIPDPAWLERLVAALDGGADVVQGVTVPARPPRRRERTVISTFDDGLHATCNIAYRRSAFLAAGGFDPDAGGRLGFRHGRQLRSLGFGEDTLLGWRVRRRGTFVLVPDALVRHHVFPPDARDSLRRTWAAGGFPALVREAPELRTTLLRHGVALGHWSRVPLYTACIALVLRQRRAAGLALVGWIVVEFRRLRARHRSNRVAVAALPWELLSDAVAAAALMAGGVRARRLVL